jgi:hypothetical protein
LFRLENGKRPRRSRRGYLSVFMGFGLVFREDGVLRRNIEIKVPLPARFGPIHYCISGEESFVSSYTTMPAFWMVPKAMSRLTNELVDVESRVRA